MSKVERFEDLICWQRSRELTNEIYSLTLSDNFKSDKILTIQIRKAAISVMLNIAEGFGRRTHKEFTHYLFIGHGSVAEVQSALYVCLDANYISNDKFDYLYDKCTEISKIISGLIKSLK